MMRTRKGATGLALGAVVALAAAACSSSGGGGGSATSSAAAAPQKGGTLYILTSARTTASTRRRATSARTSSSPPRVCAQPGDLLARARQQAGSRPGDRHRPDVRRRQDVEVHARRHGQVAGRPDGHLRRRQVRHLADLRDRRDHRTARPTSSTSSTCPRTPTARPPTRAPTRGPGQDLYDKAVTCEGQTLTFKFKKPWTDFNLADGARSRPTPQFRKDKDKGDKSLFEVFSNGPYMLQGTFDAEQGRHLGPQPELGREHRQGPQGLPRQDRRHGGHPVRAGLPAAHRRLRRGQDRHHVDHRPAVGAPADRGEPGRAVAIDQPGRAVHRLHAAERDQR